MSKTIFLKKSIPYLILLTFFIISTIFLFKESPGRSIFLLISFFTWVVLFFCTKNAILTSLLYILIVLPFNITYQLPHSVVFFDTEILLSSPYVNGVYVNYLVPTISILDLGIIFLLFSILKEKGLVFLKDVINRYRWYIYLFFIFLLVQNLIIREIVVLVDTLRFVGVLVSLILLLDLVKQGEFKNSKVYIIFIFLINVLFQGILGLIQFTRGASLNFVSLGESQVVSGMQGSSFIELNGELFLRAYGTFPHPNILAGFLLLSFFLGIYFLQKTKDWLKLTSFSLVLFSIISIILTFSRLSIIIMLLSGVILLMKYILNSKKEKLFSFAPILLLERFVNIFTSGDSSLRDRISLFKSGIDVFKDNWLVGTGIGNFVKEIGDYVPRTSNGVLLLQPVHNIFFLALANLGIVGFVLMLVLVVRIFSKNIKRVSVLGVLVISSIVLIGSFDHYLISLPQGLIILSVFLLILFKDSESLKKNKDDVNKN